MEVSDFTMWQRQFRGKFTKKIANLASTPVNWLIKPLKIKTYKTKFPDMRGNLAAEWVVKIN